MTDLYATCRRPNYGQGQNVAYTGTAGTTGALPDGTRSVAVLVTTFAYVRVGVNPTAVTSDVPVPANVLVILPVEKPTNPGSDGPMKVSAVQVASGGTLYIIPMAD